MMTHSLKMLLPATLFSLALLAGCADQGPAEEAGERIDDAVQEAQDAVNPPGPAERAGRAVDDALEDSSDAVGEALQEAGEAADDVTEERSQEN